MNRSRSNSKGRASMAASQGSQNDNSHYQDDEEDDSDVDLQYITTNLIVGKNINVSNVTIESTS